MIGIFASGCEKVSANVLFERKLGDDELFRVGNSVCTLPEADLYLTTIKDQYEGVYGSEIWDKQVDGQTVEAVVKQNVLSQLAQIKTMAQFAEEQGVSLSDPEMSAVEEAAQEFYNGLTQSDKDYLSIEEEVVIQLYSEYLLSDKVYQSLTNSIETEVSDDEARVITVQQIVFKTTETAEDGTETTYTNEQQKEVYNIAKEVLAKAKNGDDFETLAATYNEEEATEVPISRNTVSKNVEEIAFGMENDEISDIIETEEGYCILKCINSFDKEATDGNKEEIVEQRKSEAFDAQYEEYANSIEKTLNDEAWASLDMGEDVQTDTTNFFDVYNNYFAN